MYKRQARRSEDKFIPIRDDAALHRKVRDVQMERYARQAVGHLDSEGREVLSRFYILLIYSHI